MRVYKFVFIFLFFLSSFYMAAQVPLDLDNAIDLMKENNTQLKIQQQELQLSKTELSSSLSGFLPDISVSHSGFYTNDPLNVFGFKLQQKVVKQEDFNPDLLNHPNGLQHFNTQLAVRQPLLNFDALSARKALKEKVQAVNYQKMHVENLMLVELKNSYTNLQFLYEAKKVLEKSLLTYEEVLRNTKNFEEQGYVKHSDVLMVEVELSGVQSSLIEVENNISDVSSYLAWLMGVEYQADYLPMSELKLISDRKENSSLENRADILAMKTAITAQQKQLKMNKNRLLPRLNAFGEFNYHDKNILQFKTHSYLAGVSLSWNVFDGNKTLNSIKENKIKIDKADSELQLHIEKSRLELQKAQRELLAQQNKLDLFRKAKEQASEAYRIVENRYDQGLEKTADLLISQTKNMEKQVDYLEVIKDYNLLKIKIDFLTNNN